MNRVVYQQYDIEAITRRLPHRYPFLMVDRILKAGPGYALGMKNVTINEPYFGGHFPEYPVMPGVLVTEFLLQTSAFMGATSTEDQVPDPANTRFFCVGFNMKFNRPVVPGNQLSGEVKLLRKLKDMSRVKAVVTTDEGQVASGELSIAIVN
ncbi:3-hydroxyacyl-ACP dehydratase FabZ [Polycladidibacter stylochi]|uniref:3-hydroxyacyl-ACP dehydratase FabZ n=1 Tax=Polycladidibacter stylochi TaxID=1807766 RepID=UPI000830D037|nr:3-hydroxyacyl-ACP dehydratase FabZ [Pseudovibrio stylochi]